MHLQNPFHGASRDCLFCMLLASAALLLGVGTNLFRAHPMPIRYQTKPERLAREVEIRNAQSASSAEIRYLPLSDFLDLQARVPNLILLDARAEVFYQQGHLPGAVSLPRQEFGTFYDRLRTRLEADRKRPIVVYCQGGECEDSELVAKALRALGFSNLSILAGGWEQWQAQGHQ